MNNKFEYLDRLIKEELQPENGLPQDVFNFVASVTPMINVDLLVRDDDGKVLLAWRDDKYSGYRWHIPGGIIRFKESIEHRIHQVALNELKTDISWNGKILDINEIITPQQERGHFISLLVECKPDYEKIKITNNLNLIKEGDLSWFEKCPENFIECQYPIYSKYFLK